MNTIHQKLGQTGTNFCEPQPIVACFYGQREYDAPSARTSDSSTCPDAPRCHPIVVTGAIRSRPIRVMIQFTNITSKPIRTEASAHARESSYLDARKKIYLFLFSCLMIPFIFLSSFSLLLSYSSIYFPFYTQFILYLLFLFQRAYLGLS